MNICAHIQIRGLFHRYTNVGSYYTHLPVSGFSHSMWPLENPFLTFMHWQRKWQPTPVLLPGEPQGQGSLVGCCLWGRTESDMTEVT